MRKLLSATAIATIAGLPVAMPTTAQAQSDIFDAILDIDGLTRTLLEIGVLYLRTQVDVTYEGLTVSNSGSNISITGLTVYAPADEFGEDFASCSIRVERIDLVSGGIPGVSEIHIELLGATADPSCFDPEVSEVLAAAQYESITIDRVYATLSYEIGSSALDGQVHLAVADAAIVDLTASFEYFWFREGYYGEPEPALQFASGAVVVEDLGALERITPLLPPELSPESAPGLVAQGLSMMFTDFGGAVPPEGQTFITATSEAVGTFLSAPGQKIGLSFAPAEPIWFDNTLQRRFDGPGYLLLALAPQVGTGEGAYRTAPIAIEQIKIAIEGGALDPAQAEQVGLALLTGTGAPKAVAAAVRILDPLAAENGAVAMALAEELAATDPAAAYGYALSAGAAGANGALAMLDTIEASMPLAEVLAAQPEKRPVWPSETKPDIAELRGAALSAMTGLGRSRSYADAYVLASLAAAYGDISSAALRDRIAERFAGEEAWETMVGGLDDEVLQAWIAGQ